MTFTEAVIQDGIHVDFSNDPLFDSDQVDVTFPCQFATIQFELFATDLLTGIADRIRKDQGFKPMHAIDEYTDEMCDQEGWYSFYISLSDYSPTKVDNCLEFVVVNSDSNDNETMYAIELTEEEQRNMYARLDEQCLKYLGKTCADLMDEARKAMEDDS